ncbi:hypothetical protein BJ917_1518 [Pseudomonas sp. WPR_5_2]|uniref:hypothetical protein n=1 Tax=Pseudomonas sp. WPR_5_2 TaxID=1907371 RepID=UPI000F0F335A|nr:hypothetical protein [Pseudomonas sp. WPR_5_2]RKS28625.1 hypothetical protein BJ917_1518 [Pseudomonas sp. WPR_5_2]
MLIYKKICLKCNKEKPVSEFYKVPRNKDGLHSYCKECDKIAVSEYYKTDNGIASLSKYQKSEKGIAAIRRAAEKYQKSEKGIAAIRRAAEKYQKSEKGIAALRRSADKLKSEGYYRFGNGAISNMRQGAKKRGITFSLNVVELKEWWNDTSDICHYCSSTLEQYVELRNYVLNYKGTNPKIRKFMRYFKNTRHAAISTMTIDRKNNELGYEIKNIAKACWVCNFLKSNFFSEEIFKKIAPEIISELREAISEECS